MISVRIGPVTDFAVLGERWRALEQRSSPSFFQSWTWTGCLVEERFADPVLVEALEGDRTVALALFNRRRPRFGLTTLYLHESGSAELDCPYIEQNGVLTEAGREAELTALCLRWAARRHRLVLSAVDPLVLESARGAAGLVRPGREQPSPFADLAAVRRNSGDVLAGRSANTRQQIRRSDRYFARFGPIAVTPADAVETAVAMLRDMAELHQASWHARGQPGSFARPFFAQFHEALIGRGIERGEIALLRVSAGDATLGILYNFTFARRMLAYQSGFVPPPEAQSHARPGLSCHHAAMRHALALDFEVYDFLAGTARYKLSLAESAHRQCWIEAGPGWCVELRARWLRDQLPV